MGQSASTQRDQRHTSPTERTSSPQDRGHSNRHEDMNEGRDLEQSFGQRGASPSQSGTEANSDSGHAYPSSSPNTSPDSWQPSFHSISDHNTRPMRSIQEENESPLEQSQREYRSAVIARMAARRQSTMSRLGSRILPNSVIRGLLSSEEETPAEGHAHRHGVISRSNPRSEAAHSSRFSPFSSFGARGASRRRSLRGPYFIPRSDSLTSDGAHSFDHNSENGPEPTRASWRRSVRLNRVRHSLSSPITQMFGQPSQSTSQQPPLGTAPDGDTGSFLPQIRPMDTRMDFDQPHELDSVEPAVGSTRPTSPMPSQSAQGPSSLRNLPNILRARQSRTLRREEQTPLSRVLQLAAAAIAAQLSGTNGPLMPNIQSLGNDGVEGPLENFIQSLQHATSAQAAANDAQNPQNQQNPGENAPPSPPVNFLRVFRFANADGSGPSGPLNRSPADPNAAANNADGMDVDNPPEGAEGRTVTLVVVGVRSVPSGNGTPAGDQPANPGTTPPGLDALLRLPFLAPGAFPRNQDGSAGLPSRPEGRFRVPLSRPHEENSSMPPPSAEALPHQGRESSSRRTSDTGSREPLSSAPSVLSESPPGPHPPPSTPAEPGLSAVSSGASTPSRRPSSASAMSPNVLPQLNENSALQSTGEPATDNIPPTRSHQRRRSDSEYARHRDLGSGSVRRNGVVEPDNATPPTGRSWLIYVVGTNLSENHPAFATPSLFTDNPTYEDMIMLSSLLGPVKPPVASQEDLTSAGGLFRLIEIAGSLVAEAVDDGTDIIRIPDGDRCLICLSDYEVAEHVRQLHKCKHVFHRDCIDQWLTTGRNSCPLCRGQGVAETSNSNPTNPAPDLQNPAPDLQTPAPV